MCIFQLVAKLRVILTVCRITVREMDKRIKKVDPTKLIEVSGFRMDSKQTKSIPYVKSEMFLTELMEEICKFTIYSIGGSGDKGVFPQLSFILTYAIDLLSQLK